jgi:hypothetical protein
MTERERLADLARRAYWRHPADSSADGWLQVADSILADRQERAVMAVEAMEARIEAAEARAEAADVRAEAVAEKLWQLLKDRDA